MPSCSRGLHRSARSNDEPAAAWGAAKADTAARFWLCSRQTTKATRSTRPATGRRALPWHPSRSATLQDTMTQNKATLAVSDIAAILDSTARERDPQVSLRAIDA